MNEIEGEQPTIWINGVFSDSGEVSISPFDQGANLGLGVFDSLCGYDGVPFDFPKHYKRLVAGAERIGLDAPTLESLYDALIGVMAKNEFGQGRSRLRITLLAGAKHSNCIVTAAAVPQRSTFSKVVVSTYRVNERSPLVGIKSTSYASNWLTYQEAQVSGADEAIMLNSQGMLCEGATSNLFLMKGETLFTPSLSSGCLPGVTRDTILEICEELVIAVRQQDLTLEDLQTCDEAFLTSSLREVQPVESVDGVPLKTVGGRLITALQEAYQTRISHGSK